MSCDGDRRPVTFPPLPAAAAAAAGGGDEDDDDDGEGCVRRRPVSTDAAV